MQVATPTPTTPRESIRVLVADDHWTSADLPRALWRCRAWRSWAPQHRRSRPWRRPGPAAGHRRHGHPDAPPGRAGGDTLILEVSPRKPRRRGTAHRDPEGACARPRPTHPQFIPKDGSLAEMIDAAQPRAGPARCPRPVHLRRWGSAPPARTVEEPAHTDAAGAGEVPTAPQGMQVKTIARLDLPRDLPGLREVHPRQARCPVERRWSRRSSRPPRRHEWLLSLSARSPCSTARPPGVVSAAESRSWPQREIAAFLLIPVLMLAALATAAVFASERIASIQRSGRCERTATRVAEVLWHLEALASVLAGVPGRREELSDPGHLMRDPSTPVVVWSAEGEIIFASESELIGRRGTTSKAFAALGGRTRRDDPERHNEGPGEPGRPHGRGTTSW